MKTETVEALIATTRAMFKADETVSAEHKHKILFAIKAGGGERVETITINKAAEILGVCPVSVRRYAQRGYLKQIRLSERKVRYLLAEVERFAAEGKSHTELSRVQRYEQSVLRPLQLAVQSTTDGSGNGSRGRVRGTSEGKL